MSQKNKIEHFCFSEPKETKSYSQVYVAEPKENFLEKFGQLCIIVNLDFQDEVKKQTLNWAEQWSQELIDSIKNDFYNPLRQSADLEKEFEESLQRINNWLQEQKSAHQSIFKEDLLNLDIDIVLIKEDNVYFSQVGNVETYLLKDKKLVNLVEEKNESSKFLNIISGKLEKDSLLFFVNKEFFEYFSQQKISQIFKQNSLKDISKEIKKLLDEKIKQNNFFSLIISHKDVFKQKPELKDKEEIKEQEQKQKEKEEYKDKKRKKKKQSKKLKPDSEKEDIFKKAKKIKKNTLELPITRTSRLTYFRKSLLIIIIILTLLFIQSIVLLARKQIKAKQTREYQQTVEQLENVQEELSAALIYEDPSQIKKGANKFKTLLNKIPQKTDEQKQTYVYFQEEYTVQMNKFYHLNTILEPELLIDLKEKFPEINSQGLVNIGNDFYIFNPENNYIYLFNIETKKSELVNKISANVGRLKILSTLDNNNLIGLDQNQGLVNFNTIDKDLTALKLNRETPPQSIKDFNIYNRRLYTLEPLANQIYKHNQTIDGFGKEQAWIQDNTSVVNGASLAIDGSIYVLNKTGEILKLHQGKLTEFQLKDIQPALSLQDPNILRPKGNIKLFTNADMDYLYLLDGPSQRLIVLSKNGKLIKQFTSPAFNDLKDMIISKKENQAWLLSGTKIFILNLE